MLLTYDECVDLAKKIDKKSGKVCAATESQIIEPPPLAFNLSALQIESSKQFGLSAKEVQDISWQLYEKYHLITYPRTDNRYLPETEFDNSGSVLDAVILTLESESELIEKIRKSDCWIKKSVWDNKKITLHHGIIPSTKHVNPELLTEQERQVYKLIASYYVAQFYPDYEAIHRRVNFVINAEMWSTSGQKIVQTGWHDVLDVELQEDDMNMDIFADWHEDETIYCEDLAIRERQTRPPARFTDATLMEAMANISAHTEHAETKTLLKNGDGLGTETTRAFIIESLFNRGFLMKGNKTIFSTAIARDLVHALPSQYDLIDIAALWERNITSIADQNLAYKKFMLDFEKQLQDLIAFVREKKNMTVRSADEVLGISAPEKYHCLKCQSMLVLRSGKRGDFWGCSRYPECKFTFAIKH